MPRWVNKKDKTYWLVYIQLKDERRKSLLAGLNQEKAAASSPEVGIHTLGIPASLCQWLARTAKSHYLCTEFRAITTDRFLNVSSSLFAPFCFVCLLYQFSWETQNQASEDVSATLGVLPAAAVIVFKLCHGTHGWHWQHNKSKQAQLNRKQEIWVRS